MLNEKFIASTALLSRGCSKSRSKRLGGTGGAFHRVNIEKEKEKKRLGSAQIRLAVAFKCSGEGNKEEISLSLFILLGPVNIKKEKSRAQK